MKKQDFIQRCPTEKDLREERHFKQILEFGKRYKDFEWSSIESILNLLRAYDMVWVHFSKLMRPYGLSPAIFNILMTLRYGMGEKLQQHEIGKLLFVSRANVTGLVNALVRKGLAKRVLDKSDRRAWQVQITPKGKGLLECYLPIHYREVRRIFSEFSPAEKKHANALFYKLKKGIHECSAK